MKINEKNLAAFATSGNQVDREGYMMKKGDGHKSFSKRYFVLKGNLLFYFEKKNDREPLGVIILEGSTIELAESEMEEHFCFKIVFPSRSYVLSAESQQSMELWMKSLACASYDYVKLMAAELQRQLDELSIGLNRDDTSSSGPSSLVGTSEANANYYGARNPTSSVPTPPPRTRHARNQRLLPKRSFQILHEEYGAKILEDQRARWSAEQSSETSANSNLGQGSLSIVNQDSLIV